MGLGGGGVGFQNQITFCGGHVDIFWNNTILRCVCMTPTMFALKVLIISVYSTLGLYTWQVYSKNYISMALCFCS